MHPRVTAKWQAISVGQRPLLADYRLMCLLIAATWRRLPRTGNIDPYRPVANGGFREG
jgi:hypothetical protein